MTKSVLGILVCESMKPWHKELVANKGTNLVFRNASTNKTNRQKIYQSNLWYYQTITTR